MKSSYELAMERLKKQSSQPNTSLSDTQKKQIAEIDSLYRAKIAEKELFLKPQIEKARLEEDVATMESQEKQLRNEIQSLRGEMERKKEAIRQGSLT